MQNGSNLFSDVFELNAQKWNYALKLAFYQYNLVIHDKYGYYHRKVEHYYLILW